MTSSAAQVLHRFLFAAMWAGWALFWFASSRDTKPTLRRESPASLALDVAIVIPAGILLSGPTSSSWPFWLGVMLTGAGLLLAIWARRHLGRNWSGVITIKEEHELITTGPYAIVRHPIYAGLLIAIAGCGVARADWRGVLATGLFALAFWRRIRQEERWMNERFGDVYRAYSRHVASIVPYLL